jgi:diguanylate cyclase (GGDEF)-like protein
VKVLLVDNDKKQRKFLKGNLGDQDYEVLMENDGKSVMKYLEADSPELIISNIDTPGGGIDLVNNILKMEKERFPYVIFITEEQGEKHAIDSLGPIPGDFLHKPIKIDELKARVSIAERAIALQDHLREKKDVQVDLALYDDLTNVLNRQAVYERALAEMNRAKREKTQLCLAMVEVINFDKIESTFDLETANQAIQYVARAIRANVRMYDLVGRWIGAKFFLMLPGLPQENTRMVIERIYSAVTSVRVKHVDGDSILIDLAVGYTWTSNGEDSEPLYLLIEQANDSLAEASKLDTDSKILCHKSE